MIWPLIINFTFDSLAITLRPVSGLIGPMVLLLFDNMKGKISNELGGEKIESV